MWSPAAVVSKLERSNPLAVPCLSHPAMVYVQPNLSHFLSGLVAQDGAFAGRIRARSVPWVLTPRQQVASGGTEGRRGLALRQVVVELANHFGHVEGQAVDLQWHDGKDRCTQGRDNHVYTTLGEKWYSASINFLYRCHDELEGQPVCWCRAPRKSGDFV